MHKLAAPQLKMQMESAIKAYAAANYFHPDIHHQIAEWYEQNGNTQAAIEWYHRLADSKDYGEMGAVKNACHVLGKHYFKQGEKEKGRSYLWQETLYTRYTTASLEQATQQLTIMKST